MKRILIVIMMTFSVSAFTQKITMTDTTMVMSRGLQPAIQIGIPQITLKTLNHDWLKYIGNSSKEKSTETTGENLLTEVFNPNISAVSFKIYSKLFETTQGSKLTVWITQDDIVFYSKATNTDQYNAVVKYLYDFAFAEYQSVVIDELKTEVNKSADLEKELSGIIQDYEKSLKIIAEDQRSIQLANDDIVTNNDDIKSLTSKILVQKNLVDKTASDENANKGARKTLKELVNDKENVQAKKEKNEKNIIFWNKEIRDKERDVANLIEKKSLKEVEITAQKDKVKQVQTKLDTLT